MSAHDRLRCCVCLQHCIGIANPADTIIEGMAVCAPHMGWISSPQMRGVRLIAEAQNARFQPAPSYE